MREAGADCMADTVKELAKESLDNAIDQFIIDPIRDAGKEGVDTALGGEEFKKEHPELGILYQKLLDKAASKIADAAKDLPKSGGEGGGGVMSKIPGYSAGQGAAQGGAEIGGVLGTRIFLLLAMGRDIADYAAQVESAAE